MFRLAKNNKITLTKFDTASFKLVLKDIGGNEAKISDRYKAIMTIRNNKGAKAIFADDDFYFTFNSDDTKDLDAGMYRYDIEITNGRETYTVIEDALFQLIEEVTKCPQ